MSTKTDSAVWRGLLPTQETEAADFLLDNPNFDGRGIIIGILDTGVDPGADGLRVTSEGKVKIIDIVDCSGSNDVIMGPPVTAINGVLSGSVGRPIKINPNWTNPSGTYRLGHKRVYELLPSEVVKRIKANREEKRMKTLKHVESTLIVDSQDEKSKEDAKIQLSMLTSLKEEFEDPGPVYDCLVFHDGDRWQAVVDTSETGDLSNIEPMTDYRHQYQYRRFSDIDAMNYCVNIIDNGDILSIVNDVTPHGTHVASIASAFYPDQPECHGVAPGAQIVSLKIGDTRLGSMETGASLTRALIEAVKRGCNIINISYGEAVALDNYGDFISLCNELVYEHGIIIVSSAGNNGPAMSTVGCPGATTSSVIGVAALLTTSLTKVAYAFSKDLPNMNYTWSSVGPTIDGDIGVNIIAPGGAITSVSNWTLNKKQLMNGTSMSSPNATGCITLLLSAAKQSNFAINLSPIRIRRAVENSAVLVPDVSIPAQGNGLIQVQKAWNLFQRLDVPWSNIPIDINIVEKNRFIRGIYLRQDYETNVVQTFKAQLTPLFNKKTSAEFKYSFEIRLKLVPSATWITCNDNTILHSSGKVVSIIVDPTILSPGLYCEFVRVYDCDHEELGPLCSIPVVVTKPVVISNSTPQYSVSVRSFDVGQCERHFIVPPKGAQFVDAVIRDCRTHNSDSITDSSPSVLILHALQLYLGTPYRDNEKDSTITLLPGSSSTISWPVKSSWTMELVLARSWSTIVPTNFDITLYFQGVEPDNSPITITGGSRVSPKITVFSYLREVTIAPNGKLDRWITTIKPSQLGKVSSLGERDVLPDESKYYQLILEYDFDQTDKGSVLPRWPGLQGVLYESDFTGQLFMIYDSQKNLIGCGDSWPSFINVKKGSFKVILQIRHRSVKTLEGLTGLPMLLERKLTNSITLSFHKTQSEALAGNNNYGSCNVVRDGMASFHIKEPSQLQLPKGVKPGDCLRGSISYMKKSESAGGSGCRPDGYPVKYYVADTTVSETKQKSSTNSMKKKETQSGLSDVLKEAKLNYLKNLSGTESFESLFRELSSEYPSERSLQKILSSHILALYNELIKVKGFDSSVLASSKGRVLDKLLATPNDSQSRLQKIISLADDVVKDINEDNIAIVLGRNVDPDDEVSVTLSTDAQAEKTLLLSGLTIKAKALILLQDIDSAITAGDSTQTLSLDRSTSLNQTIKRIQKWDDISSSEEYWPIYFHQLKTSKKLGAALKKVCSFLTSNSPKDYDQLYEDQITILKLLGWDFYVDIIRVRAALNASASFRPF